MFMGLVIPATDVYGYMDGLSEDAYVFCTMEIR